ncbi:MAG: hypothetical protein ACJ8DT_12655, partial [Microvirga sp.]
ESGGKISGNLSTALSRTPATQRSGVEGDPGPSARLAKRRLLFRPMLVLHTLTIGMLVIVLL